MKKYLPVQLFLLVLFSFALAVSCDSGGGGGGGSGGNSASSDSTKVSINIPATTSSDVDIFMDLQPSQLSDFQYEVYFSKPNGSSESEHKYASEGRTVTFENVKYDTYDFFLKIWVDNHRKTSIYENKITKSISGSDNAVNFPSRSLSDYSNWFFVSNESELSQAVSTISERDYSADKKAVICLKQDIRANEDSFFANIREKVTIEKNGYEIAENVHYIEYILDEGTNGSGNPLSFTRTSSQVVLSDAQKEGYLFYGWYESEDFSTERVTTLDFSDRTDDITLYARWVDSIYVSDSGNDTTGDGLSVSTAVKTISRAVAKINEQNDSSVKWKIKVSGTIFGAQEIIKDVGTATDPIAESITLEGVESGTISATGISDSALTIEVGIPVTLKNITITSSGNCSYGVGMAVQHGANVTLSDGVKVTENSYTGPSVPKGIGIYVAGSKLTVTGTAEITNNTSTNASPNSLGGGIYAEGNSQIVVSGSSKITGNSASQGEGVCLSANASGTSSLEIRDSPQVQDVYLDSTASAYVPYLKADEEFIATGIVVKMSSALYKTGTWILQGDAIEAVYNKFTVPGMYNLLETGRLSKKTDADTLANISAMPFVNVGSSGFDTFASRDVVDKLIIFKIPSGTSYIYKSLKVIGISTNTFTLSPFSFTNYSDDLRYSIDPPAGINLTTNSPYADISSGRPSSGDSFIDFNGNDFSIGGTGLGYMILEDE